MKKQWVHRARKNRVDPVDRDDIFRVIYLLRDEFGLHGLSGEVVEDSHGPMYPDIFIKAVKPQIAIELQGQYHGTSELPTGYTLEKSVRYENMGIKLYEIWKEDTDGYSKELVLARLQALGLK